MESKMKTENIQRLIEIVQRLNPYSSEIGHGMLSRMHELAEEAKKEISASTWSIDGIMEAHMIINKVTVLKTAQGEFLHLTTNLPMSLWPFEISGQVISIQCRSNGALSYYEEHFKQFESTDCKFATIDTINGSGEVVELKL
jgi:hypothetical protein